MNFKEAIEYINSLPAEKVAKALGNEIKQAIVKEIARNLWLIAEHYSNNDPIWIHTIVGTKSDASKEIAKAIKAAKKEEDKDDFDFSSSYSINKDEHYGTCCFNDYHVDFTALRLSTVLPLKL